MKEYEKIVKKNYKMLLIGIIIGIFVSGLIVYAATSIGSDKVSYDNSKSGISATTMQQALDELYSKVPKGNKNIVTAYTYDEEDCYTGTESTCKKTTCYESKASGACPKGTLIEYQVNSSDIYIFNVMFDKGNTMVMQQQTSTVAESYWLSSEDYIAAGGTVDVGGGNVAVDKGPITALKNLDAATSSWNNVENQTYQMGTTVFATNSYTGCDSNGCTKNTYTLSSRTSKARMITYQEFKALGYISYQSGPKWLSTSNYWTMSTSDNNPYSMSYFGNSEGRHLNSTYFNSGRFKLPIKAVVVISK